MVGEDVQTACEKGRKPKAEVVVHLAEELAGPVSEGEKIGYMEVRIGRKSMEVPLLCDRNVERKISEMEKLGEALFRVVQAWFLQN